jgi:hypothetical protein
VSIEDTFAPGGGGSIWDITASHLALKNAKCGTLTDTGVTYPNYRGSSTATANHYEGRSDSYVGTLTGCTTAPTATVFVTQKGDEIAVEFASNTATSNTTLCTITGMPVRYRPSSNKNIEVISRDNGVDQIKPGVVQTDGTIDLWLNGTFSNVGSKGVRNCRAVYKLT